ncbi:DUF2937 family protein [Catenovulum sp. SX2]|uniref:DUF2937 family protein n=1 Tax=Catenovulum sp. SX2 TaxID=3398614 RepID=UPI003F85071B
MRQYLKMICFAFTLLYGLQIPAFVDSYKQTLDARLSQAKTDFVGFQQSADVHFNGDIHKLIQYYQQHQDILVTESAANIQAIYQAITQLEQQQQILNAGQIAAALHVATQYQSEIWLQTVKHYNYQIQFSPQVIIWGITSALLSTLLLDALLGLLFLIVGFKQRKSDRQTI